MKTIIIKQLEDNNNIYKVSDKVRVLLQNDNEYIGIIDDMKNDFLIMSNKDKDSFMINIDSIAKIRIAEENEDFYNKFEF